MVINSNSGKKLRRWTEEETKMLRELYPKLIVKKLAKHFPWRNKATIVAKAKSLNLPSAKLWQLEEDEVLRLHFEKEKEKDLLNLLPKRSWLAIMARGERLGLRRETNKPRRNVDAAYFKNWTANMAYILGFILADGCIIRGSYKGYSDSLKFGVQISDIDILEKIKKELKSGHTISKVRNAAYLSISSQELVDDLKRLGITYKKSLNEQWPDVPAQFIRDFIRGIIDGDGSIHFNKRNHPTMSLCGGNVTLEHVRDRFMNKLGVYSKLTTQSYSKRCHAHLYQISYRCNSAKKVIDYLYNKSVLYLNRKFKLAQKCSRIKIRTRKNPRIINLISHN